MTDYIMEYLQNTFNIVNKWSYITIYNFIDYAVEHFNNSKDQLAYYLYDMIDKIEFEEIKEVIDNARKY